MPTYTWNPGEPPGEKHRLHHNDLGAFGFSPSGMTLTTIRYAHPNGDNANDGLTWGTAKKDIVSAYDQLGTGGTIKVGQGTAIDSINSDRGLWLIGPGDPDFASPPTGFRQAKVLRLVGEGGEVWGANSHAGPACAITGGSGTDRKKPTIFLAGTSSPIWMENIHIQYPAVAMRIGYRANGTEEIASTANIGFRNVSYNLNQIPGNGPGMEFGYEFWFFAEHCTFNGNAAANAIIAATRVGAVATFTTTVDHWLAVGDTVWVQGVTPSGYNGYWRVTSKTNNTFTVTLNADPGGSGSVFGTAEPVNNYYRAAIAADASRTTSGQTISSGLFRIQESNFNGGGFYYKPTGNFSWGEIVMRNITHEGDFTGPEPPTCLIRTWTYGDNSVPGAGGQILIENVGVADAGGGETAAVLLEGSMSPTDLVTAINSPAIGNIIQFGQGVSSRRGTGFDRESFIGRHVGHKRSFSPSAVRYPNLASQTLTGGNWVTGKKAPDGTTNASSLSGGQQENPYQNFSGTTTAAGDWIVAGVWHRYQVFNGSDGSDFPIVSIGGAPGQQLDTTVDYFVMNKDNVWGDKGWSWLAEAHKVIIGNAGHNFIYSLRCGGTNVIEYFAPVLFRIPVAEGWSDTEVYEFVRHMHTYPSTAPAGSLSTLAGEKLLVPAGIGVGNSAAATTPGSVVKKIEVFDAAGASLGFIPVYSSIT